MRNVALKLVLFFMFGILASACPINDDDIPLRIHACGVHYIWRTNKQTYAISQALIGRIPASSVEDAKNEVYKRVIEDYYQKGMTAADGYETRAAISEDAISKPGKASTTEPQTGFKLDPIWCVDAGPVEQKKNTTPVPTGFPGGGDKAQPGMDSENQHGHSNEI